MRNSKVELLRIFAVVLVVFTHAVEGLEFVEGGVEQFDKISSFFISFIGGFGLVGDVVFLVISSYYLVDNDRVKLKKIFRIIADTFIISLIWLAITLAAGVKLPAFRIVKQIFPTIFQNNWFITYYLVFYALHPLLNLIINQLDRRGLICATAIMFFGCNIIMYAVGQFFGVVKLLYFIDVYFIVALLKRHGRSIAENKKINLIVCIASAAVYVLARCGYYFLAPKIEFLADKGLAYFHINCPFILTFVLSLFNLVNRGYKTNRAINFIASTSMLIYVIHGNNLFIEFIQPEFYLLILDNFGLNYVLVAVFLLAVILFSASILLSAAYKQSLGRLTELISDKSEAALLKLLRRRRND